MFALRSFPRRAFVTAALLAPLLSSLLGAQDEPGQPIVPARFSVRGRWDEPRALTYRIQPDGGPVNGSVDSEAFIAAVEEALLSWSATGVVDFHPAQNDTEASVTFGWRRAEHEACPAFGLDTSVAHSGPVEAGTFVHFDAERTWTPDDSGESLGVAAAHEVGHVLGLGHSKDPGSLLDADTHVRVPQPSDLAGLHSLYGGGTDGPGDLQIRHSDDRSAQAVATLRRVAPGATTAWRLFDTDGDADDEILVWRTDAAGFGTLTIYHFDPGPALARTVGPWLEAVPYGAHTTFEVGADTKRWLVTRGPGEERVRGFDQKGRLVNPQPFEYERSEATEVPHSTAPSAADGSQVLVGDLDGDGSLEFVVRTPDPR